MTHTRRGRHDVRRERSRPPAADQGAVDSYSKFAKERVACSANHKEQCDPRRLWSGTHGQRHEGVKERHGENFFALTLLAWTDSPRGGPESVLNYYLFVVPEQEVLAVVSLLPRRDPDHHHRLRPEHRVLVLPLHVSASPRSRLRVGHEG